MITFTTPPGVAGGRGGLLRSPLARFRLLAPAAARGFLGLALGLVGMFGFTLAVQARANADLPRALAIAEAAWDSPCEGRIETIIEPFGPVEHTEGVAWAGTAESFPTCRIRLNATDRTLDRWPTLCTAMVHEVGHLTPEWEGRHSDDPGSVMFPVLRAVPPECEWPESTLLLRDACVRALAGRRKPGARAKGKRRYCRDLVVRVGAR